MKIHELPDRLGITPGDIVKASGVSEAGKPRIKQTLPQYMNGSKDKESGFVRAVADGLGIGYERLFFCDYAKHETDSGLNPESPAYWLNLAYEAIIQAEARGLNTEDAVVLRARIYDRFNR